jgi:hypothetical protein
MFYTDYILLDLFEYLVSLVYLYLCMHVRSLETDRFKVYD